MVPQTYTRTVYDRVERQVEQTRTVMVPQQVTELVTVVDCVPRQEQYTVNVPYCPCPTTTSTAYCPTTTTSYCATNCSPSRASTININIDQDRPRICERIKQRIRDRIASRRGDCGGGGGPDIQIPIDIDFPISLPDPGNGGVPIPVPTPDPGNGGGLPIGR